MLHKWLIFSLVFLFAASAPLNAEAQKHDQGSPDGEISQDAKIHALEQVIAGASQQDEMCRDMYETILGSMMLNEIPDVDALDGRSMIDISWEATLGWNAYELAWARSSGIGYNEISYTSSEVTDFSGYKNCKARLLPVITAMGELGLTLEAAEAAMEASE